MFLMEKMAFLRKIGILLVMGTILTAAFATTASAQDEEDASGLFCLAGGLLCLLPIIIMWLIFIAIAVWIYKDAEKRGKSGALWLIIVILTGIIGIIVWLIIRPPIPPQPQPGYPPQQPYYPPQQPPR